MTLEQAVQLHEHIVIIYVVDGYEAMLSTNDHNTDVCTGKGETIHRAIQKLREEVYKFNSLEQIRGKT